MNAKEAKTLSEQNLKAVVVASFMIEIYKKIETAAKEGKFCIENPFDFGRSPSPSFEAQREINSILRANGYEIINHPDPDPGHPCSGGGYTTLSWK